MNLTTMMELALGEMGVVARAGLPPQTPGAVQVVSLCEHKCDGQRVYGGQTYWMAEDRAKAAEQRDIVHIMSARVLDWWGASGRVLSPFEGDPEIVFAREPSPGSLKIAQGCGYDPGSAAYRFHSAINQSSKHTSTFTRFGDTNPHCSLRQFDGVRDAPLVRESLLTADILHCHMNYLLSANATSSLLRTGDPRSARPVHWRDGQWIVRHYHGSRQDGGTNLEHVVDEKVRRVAELHGGGLIRVGARLTLCAEPGADDLKWLPITVPVGRYRELRAESVGGRPTPHHPFRVAHSPTKRSYKGTEHFVNAIRSLQRRGVPVEAVMIENKDHGEALRLKAGCDATFDSFWLGCQGSGLEAGAMQMPVIAGDWDVKALYEKHVGECPYTFANDEKMLAESIERLVVDGAYYQSEATRIAEYVERVHDYPAVALTYERILADAMGREDVMTGALGASLKAVAA
jgi:hypothetical protein